jgi:serine phosphatase RsbU (regulator of sigma subunit)
MDLFEELGIIDEDADVETREEERKWRILIVDDEPDIHATTRLLLKGFSYLDRGLDIQSAYSGEEACRRLRDDEPYALILLDVVMEKDTAGLEVVEFVRNVLNNKHTRVVLRTGQPGVAPEEDIIIKYDIDDYKSKTELTVQKLHTLVVSSLRSYNETMRIEAIVQERTHELQEKNKEIMESIESALRIQTAILPSIEYINQFLPKFGIYYKPKDIVSGDFYWFSQLGSKSIVANVDCTGHGIPGAIMSVFAYNLLNQVVNFQAVTDPMRILAVLDAQLSTMLMNDKQTGKVSEGMDMNVVTIDHSEGIVEFAGANRPLYHSRNGVLTEYPGDKFPIGDHIVTDKQFSKHLIKLEPRDRIYLFTDGIVDQFGYESGKKYSTKRLKEFLQRTSDLNFSEQLVELNIEFESWRKNMQQTDDICFICIEPL